MAPAARCGVGVFKPQASGDNACVRPFALQWILEFKKARATWKICKVSDISFAWLRARGG